MMDGEDSKAGMASPDLQKQLADLTKIVEMQVQAMTLQSQMMSASASPGMSSHGTFVITFAADRPKTGKSSRWPV